LLDAYQSERRPVAERIVKQAAGNFLRDRRRPSHPKIAEDSPEGEEARRQMGEAIVSSQTSVYLTDGTALGYVYEPSPVCWGDGTPTLHRRLSAEHATRRARAARLVAGRALHARPLRPWLRAAAARRRRAGLRGV
jgi:hypothetical protein